MLDTQLSSMTVLSEQVEIQRIEIQTIELMRIFPIYQVMQIFEKTMKLEHKNCYPRNS